MAAPIPTIEPAELIAGDTLTWRRDDLTDYPATAGWVLAYKFVNAAGSISITASASGAGHLVTVPASISAAYVPGDYGWVATVTRGTERFTVDQGRSTVRPDMAAAAALDTRSAARRALEAADTALANFGAKAYLSEFEIAGRRQKFHTPSEFMAWRSKLQAEVAREAAADRLRKGLAPRNKLLVRFTR
jgi:hypothetical protein